MNQALLLQLLLALRGYRPGAVDSNAGMYIRDPNRREYIDPSTHPGLAERAVNPPTGMFSSAPESNPYTQILAAQNKANSDAWSQDWRSQLADKGYYGWLQGQGQTPQGASEGFTGSVYGLANPGPKSYGYSVPSPSYGGSAAIRYPMGDMGAGQAGFYQTPTWNYSAPPSNTQGFGSSTIDPGEAARMRDYLSGRATMNDIYGY